jgi:hypothetical protein
LCGSKIAAFKGCHSGPERVVERAGGEEQE